MNYITKLSEWKALLDSPEGIEYDCSAGAFAFWLQFGELTKYSDEDFERVRKLFEED